MSAGDVLDLFAKATRVVELEQVSEEAANGRFENQEELDKLVQSWPSARLVAIWNSLPGVEPVRKFRDRNTAVRRIWEAV